MFVDLFSELNIHQSVITSHRFCTSIAELINFLICCLYQSGGNTWINQMRVIKRHRSHILYGSSCSTHKTYIYLKLRMAGLRKEEDFILFFIQKSHYLLHFRRKRMEEIILFGSALIGHALSFWAFCSIHDTQLVNIFRSAHTIQDFSFAPFGIMGRCWCFPILPRTLQAVVFNIERAKLIKF